MSEPTPGPYDADEPAPDHSAANGALPVEEAEPEPAEAPEAWDSEPEAPEAATFEPALPEPAAPGLAPSEPTTPEPATPGLAPSDTTTPDTTTTSDTTASDAAASGDEGRGGPGEPSLRAGLEAILLVVDEPVPEVMLAQILERPRDEVAATLRELAEEYTRQARGFELREIAGGWRFYTRDVCAPLVERFVRDGQQARLTQAALETLAVVAYRQPVSRARVSAIRGVNSDGVIRTLTLRGLIEEAGHDPEHQAVLHRTTGYFLERLGLNTLEELPDLAPYLPDDLEGIEELQQ
jgi:segregation and condensation protein B